MKHPGRLSKTFPAAGFVVLLILGLAGQAFANKKPKFVYVANFGSNNVSAYTIDSATGALTPVPGSPFATGRLPRSVAVDPSGKFAYVTNECLSNISCSNGAVSAYTINSTTGALTPVLGSPFAAWGAPFSVTVDPSGKFAFVVDMCPINLPCTNNTISAYTINRATGALTPVPGSPFAAGEGAFSVTVGLSGKFAYVANSGYHANNVSAYSIDSATGALTPIPGSPFATGFEPVAVAVDPSGKFAFVSNIGDGNVWAYTIDGTTGALTAVPGSPFAPGTYSVSVAMDPSGKFVYLGNECYYPSCSKGIVWGYAIDSTTGALAPVPGSPFAVGTVPRSVAVDPSGKFAYVTNLCLLASCQNGGVSAYTIDSSTGALSPVSGSPYAGGQEPWWVAIASQSTVPFSAFKLWAWIDVDRKTSFEVAGLFTLGAGSDGINPLTEDVTVQVGNFSTTIPAGSFKQKWRGASEYKGFINGVDVEVAIYHIRDNRFWFTAEGKGQILTGIVNPVTVGLTIGDDEGSTAVSADIDR